MSYKYTLKWMLASHISRLLIASLVPLATLPYITRTLSPSGLGIYQFVFSFVSNFIILGALGIPTFGQREAASVRDKPHSVRERGSHLFVLGVSASCVTYLILIAIAASTPQLRPHLGLIALLGITIPASAISAEWLLLALDDFVFVSIRSGSLQILFALLIFLFVKSPDDIDVYALLSVGPYILTCFLNWSRIKTFIDLKVIDKTKIWNTFKGAFPFLLSTLAISLYTNMDSVYLGLYYDTVHVGHYALAKRLLVAGIAFSTSLGSLLVPRLTNTFTLADHNKFENLVSLSIRFVIFIVLPAAVGFGFLAEELALILGGKSYYEAVIGIYILSPTIFLVALAHIPLNQILIAKGQEFKASFSWIIGGLFSVLLGIILVPRFGIAGAAATCTCSEIVVTICALYFTRGSLVRNIPIKEWVLAVAATAFMFLVLCVFRKLIPDWAVLLRLAIFVVAGAISFAFLTWPVAKGVFKSQKTFSREARSP